MPDDACSLAGYYAERAAQDDAVYDKPERRGDLARLRGLLLPLVAGQRVLEIAAGTGYWTEALATTADAIMATDVNAEAIAVAAQRHYSHAEVSLRTADAFGLDDVPGEFDVVFCGSWRSQIGRADIPRFLAALRARVGSGTGLVLLEDRSAAGSGAPVTADLADVGAEVAVTELDHYWLATCVLR
jgi:SAM-dependent methyltransferase